MTPQREVLTAGVDLAAQPADTGACLVRWDGSEATVEELARTADDDAIVRLVMRANKTGIDAPFGWPDEFVEVVSRHRDGQTWPGRDADDQDAFRKSRLAYRETDREVMKTGARPLSVSTDKIGVAAFRCAYLLDRLGTEGIAVQRDGSGSVVEVYPAAALDRWNLPCKGYKRPKGRPVRANLLAQLTSRAQRLHLSDQQRILCLEDDDCLDALVSAMVARAADLGLTTTPGAQERERAQREGWIHLPRDPDSLQNLIHGSN